MKMPECLVYDEPVPYFRLDERMVKVGRRRWRRPTEKSDFDRDVVSWISVASRR